MIAGIGIPVELDYESVTLGYVLKAEYYLPDNTTLTMHFMQDPFNPITHDITSRRKRSALSIEGENNDTQESIGTYKDKTNNSTVDDHYEKYDIEAVEIDNGNDTTVNDDDDDGKNFSEDFSKIYTAADYRISKPNDFSTARWSLFKGIEMLAER